MGLVTLGFTYRRTGSGPERNGDDSRLGRRSHRGWGPMCSRLVTPSSTLRPMNRRRTPSPTSPHEYSWSLSDRSVTHRESTHPSCAKRRSIRPTSTLGHRHRRIDTLRPTQKPERLTSLVRKGIVRHTPTLTVSSLVVLYTRHK